MSCKFKMPYKIKMKGFVSSKKKYRNKGPAYFQI